VAAWAALDDQRPGAEPAGPVILTVVGNIAGLGSGPVVRLDRAMLEALGTTKLKTSTAWTAGEPEFEGVLARDLLKAVGAEGALVIATALNDYVVEIPLQELYDYPRSFGLEDGRRVLGDQGQGPDLDRLPARSIRRAAQLHDRPKVGLAAQRARD
jgi:hypothetical protein